MKARNYSEYYYFSSSQVSISFAKILVSVTRPRTALLGNIPGTQIYRNVDQYAEAKKVPGILIIRVDSAIYFSNSNYVKERWHLLTFLKNFFAWVRMLMHALSLRRILRWLRDEQELLQENKLPRIETVIVEMSREFCLSHAVISKVNRVFSELLTFESYLPLTAVINIDSSGVHAFEDLLKALEKKGIQVTRSTTHWSLEIIMVRVLKYEEHACSWL